MSAFLRRSFHGLSVDVEEAVSFLVSVDPGEVVHERPHIVALDRDSVFHGLMNGRKVFCYKVDSGLIVDLAVFQAVR